MGVARDETVEQRLVHAPLAARFRYRNDDAGRERHPVRHGDGHGAFLAARNRCARSACTVDAWLHRQRRHMGCGDCHDAMDHTGRRSRSASGDRSRTEHAGSAGDARRHVGRTGSRNLRASRSSTPTRSRPRRRLPRLLVDGSGGRDAASDDDRRLRTARDPSAEFLARVRHRDGEPRILRRHRQPSGAVHRRPGEQVRPRDELHVGNATRCANHVVPLTAFSTDLANNTLPNYVWITPNLCHDMHDCSVAAGDAWLSSFMPKIIDSPAFASSVVFLAWNEGTTTNGGGGHVPLVVMSPSTPAGFRSSAPYDHYSLLRTMEGRGTCRRSASHRRRRRSVSSSDDHRGPGFRHAVR